MPLPSRPPTGGTGHPGLEPGGGGSTRRGACGCRFHQGPPAGGTGRPRLEPGCALVHAERPHAPLERVAGGRGQPRCGDTRRQRRLVRAGSQRRRGRLFPRAVIVFLYVVVFMDLLLCKNIYLLCKSPDLGQSTISGGWMNILRLLTLLSFFLTSSSSPTDHRTGRTDTPQHAVG